MNKRYHATKKKRLITVITTSSIVFLLTVGILFTPSQCSADNSIEWIPVTVETGDTLWNFAQGTHIPEIDTRTIVKKIIEYNSLNSPLIRAGEILYIPTTSVNKNSLF